MLVKTPTIPPTNEGIRQYLMDVAKQIKNDPDRCPGYSVVEDPLGRKLVSATVRTTTDEMYSISVEINPVAG